MSSAREDIGFVRLSNNFHFFNTFLHFLCPYPFFPEFSSGIGPLLLLHIQVVSLRGEFNENSELGLQFFTFCRTELVLLSIGQSLPIWQIALVTLVYSVAGTLFFLTPGGIGAVEISSLLLYTKLGLEREIAASLVLLDRCIGFLFPSAMGLFFLAILSRKIALESY
ncbi:hypothetical protein B6U74_07280 [Candidatus Bathyarchaeota archaeon ex4484_205]|nr:MAG: hypothetical protein B6U74_07280 [Candidatus Bathyarchaeota archaeon ex4484_205]